MPVQIDDIIGPVLFLDAAEGGTLHLAALFIAAEDAAPSPVETAEGIAAPEKIAVYDTVSVWRARFAVPADRASTYRWNGETYEVAGAMGGDLAIAYVSCNGEEIGDLEREGSERNAMWARLRDEHKVRPFALMLHGGDQVYADEVTDGHPLSDDWPDDIEDAPDAAALASLTHHLRERFMERYVSLYRSPEFAWLAARVPSLTQWDDHDICDGWGSLPEEVTCSAVGQTLFAAAREATLVFQHACADGSLPARFADTGGAQLGWTVSLPDLRILAPDLRSERTRTRVMGPGGWAMMDAEAARPAAGHTFLMSSVPLLGPRMSLLERLMVAIPKMQKYEDDLRDQWQSRSHRDEWRRMLRLVRDLAHRDGHDIVALSGEIHLATRATMDLKEGRTLDQLVASGIAHRPPPKGWARFLGALAALGEDPLPEHPITIRRLPGQRGRYVAERNYLVLERIGGAWQARWHLEESGMTEPLPI
ncbi:hypothetical protein ATO13_09001 [Stappia sp. 22II-S9-Z10]|nr:hypothetical protein ATO13_09001 [Stappia sp. 22II-S9-Z10]